MFLVNFLLSIFFYCLGFISFILFGGVLIIISFFPRRFLFAFTPFFSKVMLFSLGVKIIQNKPFPLNGPYIIMCNHSSFIDIFAFPSVIRGMYTGVSAAENFKIPFLSLIFKRFNVVPIVRKNSKDSIKIIKKLENYILSSGDSFVILPEGTRTINGKLQKVKKGGFHMSCNTNLPILPIISSGAFRYKPKNRFTIKPGIIEIIIGDPIYPENFTVDELAEYTRNKMKKILKEK